MKSYSLPFSDDFAFCIEACPRVQTSQVNCGHAGDDRAQTDPPIPPTPQHHTVVKSHV